MHSIEEHLQSEKLRLNQLEAPLDMEVKLRAALNNNKSNPAKKRGKLVAAAVILMLLFGYSWDAMAYYGKRILGYEKLMTGSVEQLASQGKGQKIGESAVMPNGVTVTLDGLIMDNQGFTTFIKVQYPEGYTKKNPGDTVSFELKGFCTYVRGSGSGEIKDNGSTEYWVRTFDDEPMILEKRMQLIASMTVNNQRQMVKIPFILNRREAYVPSVGQIKIDKKIDSPYGTIVFDNIEASPLYTVVMGRIVNSANTSHLSFELYNGGKLLSTEGSSMSSSNDRDFVFSYKFSGITQVEDLVIKNICFEKYVDTDRTIRLKTGMQPVELGSKPGDIILQKVSQQDSKLAVQIRCSHGIRPIAGFFKDDQQLQDTSAVSKEGEYTIIEYQFDADDGQPITMEMKSILYQYPVTSEVRID